MDLGCCAEMLHAAVCFCLAGGGSAVEMGVHVDVEGAVGLMA
jgi:hypothetical protein